VQTNEDRLMARKQFVLRIDPELWKELEKWAADELRSINAQIEWLLREAVRERKGGHSTPSGPAGDEAEKRLGDEMKDSLGAPAHSSELAARHHR
jgi:hypothetical protein